MKNVLKNVILLCVLGFFIFQFRGPIRSQFGPIWQNLSAYFFYNEPCEEPIPYKIGTFDKSFNISEEYFLSALKQAEAIWEKPSGVDLFNYEPEADAYDTLQVNLVYDYRQEATKTLRTLGINVENTKASYDALRAKFNAEKSQYEKDRTSLNAKITAFNKKTSQYEKDVAYWNSQGGAPQGEYNKLQATRAELDSEAKQLKTLEASVNRKANELNALVTFINRIATTLNLQVEKYNDINVARGESFEEGVFYSEGFKRSIDVYEFSSRDKLVRVLAHELGHALGIEHLSDAKAIMYEYNQGNSLSLSENDMNALKLVCED